MPSQAQASNTILRRFKHLQQHLLPDEIPLFTIPAIWDSGQQQHSTACDVIVTNQRVFGYYFVRFPRERLFQDALPLASLKAVSLRQKSFEPVFRELLVSAGNRKIYIRAPRQKITRLYSELRSAIEHYAPEARVSPGEEVAQEIATTFERSPLAATLLLVGGLVLEIGGALLWLATQSLQTALPLFVAGVVAVVTAALVARQRRITGS